MSDVIWSDEHRARLEESADRLTEDVIYEKRCLTMDDRIIFIGLVTRLKTMAAKFGAVMDAQRLERQRLELEREELRQKVAAFEARQKHPEPELISFYDMKRRYGLSSVQMRRLTARKDFPQGRSFDSQQQSKRYWNREEVKQWFADNPEKVQDAVS